MFDNKTIEIFSSRDMIREQLITYAKTYLDMYRIDFSKTSYLSYIINVMSALTANLIYYNTSVYREFFLTKAQQKESVLNIAAMLGYTAELAKPASAFVMVNMPIEFRSSATIVLDGRYKSGVQPYRFYANNVVFSSEHDVRIDVIVSRGILLSLNIQEINNRVGGIRALKWKFSNDRKSVYFLVEVTQVQDEEVLVKIPKLNPFSFHRVTVPFSDHLAGITLSTVGIRQEIQDIWDAEEEKNVKALVEVEDDRVYWVPRNSLFLVNSGDYGYMYRVSERGVNIYFGNGIVGTQPTSGDTCSILVSRTAGYEGNVIAGSINRSDKITIDVAYGDKTVKLPVMLKCINNAPATGGRDYPTIDQIRTEAIDFVTSHERLVTQNDYQKTPSIVTSLPIQHTIPILKRSDLKINDISLFTDMVFNQEYMPTKNVAIYLDSTGIIQIDRLSKKSYEQFNQNAIVIRSMDIVDISPGQFEVAEDLEHDYVSIFDIIIDTDKHTCEYYYILDNIEKEPVIKQYFSENTRTILLPRYVSFDVEKDDDPNLDTLNIVFHADVVNDDPKYLELECILEIDEDGTYIPMTYVDSTGDTGVRSITFEYSELVKNIDPGMLSFDFMITAPLETSEEKRIMDCRAKTVIKNSLKDKMGSKVKYTDADGYWGLMYDVPVIRKDYMDYIDSENLHDIFIANVMEVFVIFDMSTYKMLTDHVNLKFSNTTGYLTNMNYNKNTKGFVHMLDPEVIPGTVGSQFPVVRHAYTCCVTNDINPWNIAPWSKDKGGFLAMFNGNNNEWTFQELRTNDIVLYYAADPDVETLPIDKVGATKLIYNGERLCKLTKKIPLDVNINVWPNTQQTVSDQEVINKVKNKLLQTFINRLGYDKPLYRSEMTRAIQELPEVEYCVVLKPEHDIFFNYSTDDFSHEELLRYSPQLVYITFGNINVTVRK